VFNCNISEVLLMNIEMKMRQRGSDLEVSGYENKFMEAAKPAKILLVTFLNSIKARAFQFSSRSKVQL